MTNATIGPILGWIQIIFSIPILGHVYSPFDQLPRYAGQVRFVVVPVMLLSGLWMWSGGATLERGGELGRWIEKNDQLSHHVLTAFLLFSLTVVGCYPATEATKGSQPSYAP